MKKFHAFMTVAWAVLAIPTCLLWKESILWVALMSVWANLATHWGAWQAAKAEKANESSGNR